MTLLRILAHIPSACMTKGALGSRAKARERAALVSPIRAGTADPVCSADRRKFSLLTGHGISPRCVPWMVEGPAGQSSAKVVNQRVYGSAKIDPLMAALITTASMATTSVRQPTTTSLI